MYLGDRGHGAGLCSHSKLSFIGRKFLDLNIHLVMGPKAPKKYILIAL